MEKIPEPDEPKAEKKEEKRVEGIITIPQEANFIPTPEVKQRTPRNIFAKFEEVALPKKEEPKEQKEKEEPEQKSLENNAENKDSEKPPLIEIHPPEFVEPAKAIENEKEKEFEDELKNVEPPPIAIQPPVHTEEETLEAIKVCLKEKSLTLSKLLEGQTVIGQSEEGAEFDIIMIPKLIELITPICSGRITTEEINSLIKKMNENQADNFLLKELLPLFGEDYKTPDKKAPDEEENDEIDYDDLMENIDKLDEESMAIIIGIIQYLEGKNENVFDLYKNSIYKQQISVGEHEIGIEVIDAQDFYGVLKEAGILTE